MMTTYSKFSISLAVSEAAKALGYELREQQSKVAESFTSGRDVFVSLPTGSGKTAPSPCNQIMIASLLLLFALSP